MPVPHRSMEPAQHGRVVAETPVDFHTGNDPQVQQPRVPAEAHVVRRAHSFRRVDLHRGEEPSTAVDERPLFRFLFTTAADGPQITFQRPIPDESQDRPHDPDLHRHINRRNLLPHPRFTRLLVDDLDLLVQSQRRRRVHLDQARLRFFVNHNIEPNHVEAAPVVEVRRASVRPGGVAQALPISREVPPVSQGQIRLHRS